LSKNPRLYQPLPQPEVAPAQQGLLAAREIMQEFKTAIPREDTSLTNVAASITDTEDDMDAPSAAPGT